MSPTAASEASAHSRGHTFGDATALQLPMLTWDAPFARKDCMAPDGQDSDSGRHSSVSSQSGPGSPLDHLGSPFSRHSSSSSQDQQVTHFQHQTSKPSSPASFRGTHHKPSTSDDEIAGSRESSVDHTDYSHFFAQPELESEQAVARPVAKALQARRFRRRRKPSEPLCYAASPAAVSLHVDWKGRATSQHMIAFATTSGSVTAASYKGKISPASLAVTSRSPAATKPMPGLRTSKQQLERKRQRKERKARLRQMALRGEVADATGAAPSTPATPKPLTKKTTTARAQKKPSRQSSTASSSRSSASSSPASAPRSPSTASSKRTTPSPRRPSTSTPTGCGVACATVAGKQCACCGNKTTPLWRDMEGKVPLCNACGIRYKKYHVVCGHCLHVPNKQESALPRCAMCNTRGAYVRRPGAQQIATLMQHPRVQAIMGDMDKAAKKRRN